MPEVDQAELSAIKALAIEMSRDPREGIDARGRALMACTVLPAPIQKWIVDAGALEPLLDSLTATIEAGEKALVEKNEILREALRLARNDLRQAIKHITAELKE